MRSFVKIKSSRSRELILSFTDIGNSNVADMSFNAIHKNNILEKNSKFTEVPESYKLAYFVLFILCSVANVLKE